MSNSQCSINGAVNASGNNLNLTLLITFSSNFAGNRLFYLAARKDTINSGWQAVGSAVLP